MRLADIMSTEVKTMVPTASAQDAWQEMRRLGIHHLVIMTGGKVAGVISDRDLGGARGRAVRDGKTVAQLMTRGVVTAAPDVTVRRAANLLRGRSIGSLPVIERGRLRGLVTIADLLDVIGRRIERVTRDSKRWTMKHRARPKSKMPTFG